MLAATILFLARASLSAAPQTPLVLPEGERASGMSRDASLARRAPLG